MVVSPVNVDEKPYVATTPQDSGVSEAISNKLITGTGFHGFQTEAISYQLITSTGFN
jgi:hypothetical protein